MPYTSHMTILFFIISYFAEVVGTIAGFGSSTIALPLSLFFFDFRTALVLVAFLHILGNVGRLGFFRFGVDWKVLLKFGIPSVIFSVIGAYAVAQSPQELLKGLLGLFLILYAALSWSSAFRLRPSTPLAVTGGTLSGFLAGLIGTGGALRGMFLSAFSLHKEQYVSTAAAIALLVDLTRLPVYFASGFLDKQYYWMIPVILAVALVGSYTGKQIVKKIPQQVFRKVVLVALAFGGVYFVFSWLSSYAA